MEVALIITTYNAPLKLRLVLNSAVNQSRLPDEIIIADDGSDQNTASIINEFSKNSPIQIIHSWQSDKGFRAAKSRNKAIAKSRSDYIILVDGDMILHKDFIKDHYLNSKKGYFIQGTRALINDKLTIKIENSQYYEKYIGFFSPGIKNRKNTIHSGFLSKFFSRKSRNLKGIKTCNLSFFKSDCIKINGFNNDFEGWGREDSEFIVRLFNIGLKRLNLRFQAIQFHLYHQENSKKYLDKNNEILKNAIKKKSVYCKDGISRFL